MKSGKKFDPLPPFLGTQKCRSVEAEFNHVHKMTTKTPVNALANTFNKNAIEVQEQDNDVRDIF